jgi:hypothetical protein
MFDPRKGPKRYLGAFWEIWKGRPTLRIPAEGSEKAPAKTFGRREQERSKRRVSANRG